jgi:hypothetical protein
MGDLGCEIVGVFAAASAAREGDAAVRLKPRADDGLGIRHVPAIGPFGSGECGLQAFEARGNVGLLPLEP